MFPRPSEKGQERSSFPTIALIRRAKRGGQHGVLHTNSISIRSKRSCNRRQEGRRITGREGDADQAQQRSQAAWMTNEAIGAATLSILWMQEQRARKAS